MFGLAVITVLPALYLIGGIASLAPIGSYGVAFYILVAIWFVGMAIASRIITDRLGKRQGR